MFLGNSDVEEGCATSALDIKVILNYFTYRYVINYHVRNAIERLIDSRIKHGIILLIIYFLEIIHQTSLN